MASAIEVIENVMESDAGKKNTLAFNGVFYALMGLNIVLNVVGSPLLKQLYLLELVAIFACCLALPIRRVFIPLIFFFFVEGQGRILMEYASFTRFIYDALVSVVILRLLIKTKKISPIAPFPNILLAGIILHVLWYFISIFNPHLPTPLVGIIASKTHLYPLIFFIVFINSKELRSSELIDEIANFVLFCCLTQAGLTIFQYFATEKHLFLISDYYKKVLGEGEGMRFTGPNFRATGTTYAPAAFTSYLFITVSLCFMRSRQSVLFSIVIIVAAITGMVSIFLSQVRSALIKYIMMLFLSLFFNLIVNRRKERILVMVALLSVAATFTLAPLLKGYTGKVLGNHEIVRELNLGSPMERLMSLLEFEQAYSGRISLNQFIEIAWEKIAETPFGIGAGRASPAASLFGDKIKDLPFYGAKFGWYYENFYMALVVEFGIGMIFFTFILLFLPSFAFYNAIKALRRQKLTRAKLLFLSGVGMSIIVVGNWASTGLVSLPENFVFWLYAIIAMSTYQQLQLEIQEDDALADPSKIAH